jgi:hypothetical protein
MRMVGVYLDPVGRPAITPLPGQAVGPALPGAQAACLHLLPELLAPALQFTAGLQLEIRRVISRTMGYYHSLIVPDHSRRRTAELLAPAETGHQGNRR